ncbi:hypothetical protein Vretifemale_8725 [Volvox reticuliferus]|uniref:RPA43 OB domain-containing protein n=1 Tax=Volvox reticuliferus TaxID=1737510 RepID=A0A8J4FLX7_9CHLO|nr:hypothetical protein Vretifemale_8725 [Volvox reticuliferus]
MLMVFRAYLRMSEFPFSSNALYKARTHFAVELHPSTVENVTEGVKDQLNANLLRYVEEFEGVLLSYSNLEILTKKPIIHPYFPFFHLDVRADVLLFKPKPGMTLVGQVNLLGEDYISALVFGVLNVAIPARDVMKELQFLREEARWIHTQQPQHQILENSYIVFKVEGVRDHGGYFQIAGSLRDPNTGALDFLHPGLELPEGPAPAWTADNHMEDGFGDPWNGGEAYDIGGAGTAFAAATTATAQKPKDSTGNGTVDNIQNGHTTRKRPGSVVEEPKGKRRRKDGEDAGNDGLTPAPVPRADAGLTGGGKVQNDKKLDKRPARDGDEDELKGRAKADKNKEDEDRAKDKATHSTAVTGTEAAEHAHAAAATAAASATPRMNGMGTGSAQPNGEATAPADREKQREGKSVKKSSRKDKESSEEDKESSKKEGKESSKKERKESSKKEGKESSKKEGKESGKKEGKESSKEGKESSKKEGKESGKKEGKESSKKEGKESSKKEGKESSKAGKESSKEEGKESSKEGKESSKAGKESAQIRGKG